MQNNNSIFSQPVDRGALNLARSIALAESDDGSGKPNYNAVGDAGTSKGAYQWQPGNFENSAKQYGLNPADFSPENQDKVAYAEVKSMKDAGYSPEQIAAAHNAGKGSLKNDAWKTNVGTTTINGKKINYDTPSYVNKVNNYYLKIAGNGGPQNVPGIGVVTNPPRTLGAEGLNPNIQQNQSPTNLPGVLSPEDQKSADQYGATFPSQTGEGPLAAGLKAAGNTPSSLLNLGKGLYNAARHPIDTIQGATKGLLGGISEAGVGLGNALSGNNVQVNDQNTQTFDALKGAFKDRYGSLENLQRSATNDPVGFGADVLAIIQGGAGLADLATGSKVGAASDAINYIKGTGKTMSDAIAEPELKAAQVGIKVPEGASSEVFDRLGTNPTVVQQLKTNIVDGLPSQLGGKLDPELVNKIAALDPQNYSTIDDFVKDASKIVGKGQGLYSNAVNNVISKVGKAGLYPIMKAKDLASNVATQALGASTGEGGTTVKTALQSAMESGDSRAAFKEALRGNVTPESIVDDSYKALDNVNAARAQAYQEQLAKISDNTKSYEITPVLKELDNQLDGFGITKGEKGSLDFSRSKFALDPAAQNDINKIVDYVKNYGSKTGDRTAVGLDNLKQVLSGYYSPNSDYRAFVQGIKSSIWNPAKPESSVLGQVPGYGKLTGDYQISSDLIDDLKKSLSLGGKAATDTTFKKLISALKDNNPIRNSLIKELNANSGSRLLPHLAGSDMSQFLPGGLIGTLEKAGGLYGIFTGAGLSALLPLLTVASPRVVGEFINALGLSKAAAVKIFSGLGVPNATVFVGEALNRLNE